MNREMLARLLERHCPGPALLGMWCACGEWFPGAGAWSEHVTRVIYPPNNVAGPSRSHSLTPEEFSV